jgi:hypothetical protein
MLCRTRGWGVISLDNKNKWTACPGQGKRFLTSLTVTIDATGSAFLQLNVFSSGGL